MHSRAHLGRVSKICKLLSYNTASDPMKFEFANDLKCTNDPSLAHALYNFCVVCLRPCTSILAGCTGRIVALRIQQALHTPCHKFLALFALSPTPCWAGTPHTSCTVAYRLLYGPPGWAGAPHTTPHSPRTRCGVALHVGRALHNLQVHKHGGVHADDLAVVEQ